MGKLNFHGYINFAILFYSRNSRKFDAREKYVFYSKYKFILYTCAYFTL